MDCDSDSEAVWNLEERPSKSSRVYLRGDSNGFCKHTPLQETCHTALSATRMGPLERNPLPPPFNKARPGAPIVVSHRAGGNEAPENTLAALRHAEKAGSKLMQMDILQIADGTPIVYHDPSLKRTHGMDLEVKKIPTVADLPPFPEVLEPCLAIGGAKPIHTTAFKYGRRIALVKELLDEAAPDTFLLLEFWEEDKELVEKVVHMIKDAGRSETVILGNPFSTKTWQFCKEALPGVSTILPLSEVFKLYAYYMFGLLFWWRPPAQNVVFNIPLFTTDWHIGLAKPPPQSTWKQKLGVFAFFQFCNFMKWLLPRPKLFSWLQEHGIPVMVFILNRPVDWDYALSLDGISAIMTDHPMALNEYLKARQFS
ncbi:hypothetical protein KFL_000820170 [Klebsormidium nitens]|uniref:glycerophosphodiester phosphodiesterase n=1 Tax=Klebsormidium nitens TaxID=105231 RepID=A0A1Y1HSA5_KLENI|nr:hypothetical protein KFL_000820170 [Klebsormidium nitens]|eukprot:GAQ81510.1 hypothetical protein KFL_000820170 [Klebsormidium nitens]